MIPSLEGWPTKAKEAPSPHEVRLALLDTNPLFQSLGGITPPVRVHYPLKDTQFAAAKIHFPSNQFVRVKKPRAVVSWYDFFCKSYTICSFCKYLSCIYAAKTARAVNDINLIHFVNPGIVAALTCNLRHFLRVTVVNPKNSIFLVASKTDFLTFIINLKF